MSQYTLKASSRLLFFFFFWHFNKIVYNNCYLHKRPCERPWLSKLLISYAFVKNILCWKVLIPKVFETLASLSVWILVEITKPGSISAKNLLYCREIIQRSSLMSVLWGLFMTSVFAWARHVELVACVTTAMPSFTELGEKPVETMWKLCKCPQISNVLWQPTGYEKTRDACIIIRSDSAYAYV